MTSRDFCYWLQGLFELDSLCTNLNDSQVAKIKAHLNMVFIHEIDPSTPNPKLDEAHSTTPRPPVSYPIKARC